jgi:hypothetical protein
VTVDGWILENSRGRRLALVSQKKARSPLGGLEPWALTTPAIFRPLLCAQNRLDPRSQGMRSSRFGIAWTIARHATSDCPTIIAGNRSCGECDDCYLGGLQGKISDCSEHRARLPVIFLGGVDTSRAWRGVQDTPPFRSPYHHLSSQTMLLLVSPSSSGALLSFIQPQCRSGRLTPRI